LDTITFPVGTSGIFQITLVIYGTSAVLANNSVLLVNATAISNFNSGNDVAAPLTSYTSSVFFQTFFIQIISESYPVSVEFFDGTYPLLCTNGDLFVVKASPLMSI